MLSDAWFKWTLAKFVRRQGVDLEQVDLGGTSEDLNKILLAHYPKYEEAFEKEFAEHVCDIPGCSNCRVIDGHLKCRRFVCATRNINFVEAKGFPKGGFFKGCTNKPSPGSTWCAECNQFIFSREKRM